MKSYIVIGLGLFGAETARKLCELGCEVLAMDVRENLVHQVANHVTHAVTGDGQDKKSSGLWVPAPSTAPLWRSVTIWLLPY